MARRNIWEQIWESTEGPTVTVTIPRDHAESLLKVLAASLEEEMPDDMGMEDDGDMDLDDLDFGDDGEGGDEDDMDDMDMDDLDLDLPAGDDDSDMDMDGPPSPKKGPGRPPGSKNKPKDDGGKKKEKEPKKDDSDDETTDENADCYEDGNRPQTALGESAFTRAARALAKPRKKA